MLVCCFDKRDWVPKKLLFGTWKAIELFKMLKLEFSGTYETVWLFKSSGWLYEI